MRVGSQYLGAGAEYPTREIPRHFEPPAIATDGKGRVVFLNLAGGRLLGVTERNVLGTELSSVLSREAMDTLARSAILRIPGAAPRAERVVYILDPAAISCPLSKREYEVVALLTDGYTALNIAARLNLSRATVRNYIQNALQKLEVHSQVEIVALAIRRGWVDRQERRRNSVSTARHRSTVDTLAAGG